MDHSQHTGGHGHPETFDEVVARGFLHDRLEELQREHEARVRARAAPIAPRPALEAVGAVATRKDAAKFSRAEQVAFRNAVVRLVEEGRYQERIGDHMDMSHNMHGTMGVVGLYRFLAWHRRYLVEFEREIQRVDAILRPVLGMSVSLVIFLATGSPALPRR